MINWLQGAVLAFFGAAMVIFTAVLLLTPDVYAAALRLPAGSGLAPELAFAAGLSLFLMFLAVAVVRRWRWTFWLILLAFVAGGALRIPASLLELAGRLPSTGPAWYTALQAGIGAIQLAIGLVMLAGWRSGGVWAMPRRRR